MRTILKILIFLLIGLSPYLINGQNTINLLDLYKAVDTNNPLSKIPSGIDSK